jgi:SagB-type dehydrogenase family enzyme
MTEIRTNSFLSVYPDYSFDDPCLVVEDLNANQRMRIKDHRLFQFLFEFDQWTPKVEAIETIARHLDCSREEAEHIFTTCQQKGLLIHKDDDIADFESNASSWYDYNWVDAVDFYAHTRNYPYVDYSEWQAFATDQNRMEEYAEEEPVPPVYKTYANADRVELPDPDGSEYAGFDDLNDISMLDPDLDANRPDVEALSRLLYYVFGERGTITFEQQGTFLRRTSPSGGARHPTEAYVAAVDVDGLDPGFYHYSVKEHALEKLDTRSVEHALDSAVYELNVDNVPGFEISCVLFLGSVLERSMWRYRESRTYRIILNDVGHLLETLKFVCLAEDLYTYFGHGFDESEMEDILGLDGLEEPLFMHATVGY